MKKPVRTAIIAVCLIGAVSAPAMAAGRDWEDAYRKTITSSKEDYWDIYQLVDLDVDGVPELLIGGRPGSGLFSSVTGCFTYKNGAVQKLNYGDVFLSTAKTPYTLYRSNSTGAYRVEGGYGVRAGAGYYASVCSTYALSANTLKVTDNFVKDDAKGSSTYYVSGDKVSASEYQSRYAARNNGWSRVDGYSYSALTLNSSSLSGRKPTAKELDSLFSGYKDSPVAAVSSKHKLNVDGSPVGVSAYNIGGNNYFKLRDVASILSGTEAQFEVGWDGKANRIALTRGKSYTPVGGERAESPAYPMTAKPTSSDIFIDNAAADIKAYNIGGNNYFKLRDLGKALGFNVVWDAQTMTIGIETDKPYSE